MSPTPDSGPRSRKRYATSTAASTAWSTTFHDLLRSYALECVAEEADPDRAIKCLLHWYLQTTNATDRALAPRRQRVPLEPGGQGDHPPLEFDGFSEALDWCECERANLIAGARQAGEHGWYSLAWQFPAVLGEFFYLRRYRADWIATHLVGMENARRAADHHLGRVWCCDLVVRFQPAVGMDAGRTLM